MALQPVAFAVQTIGENCDLPAAAEHASVVTSTIEEWLSMVERSSRAPSTPSTELAVLSVQSIVEEEGRDNGLRGPMRPGSPMLIMIVPVPTRIARGFSTAADSLITCE